MTYEELFKKWPNVDFTIIPIEELKNAGITPEHIDKKLIEDFNLQRKIKEIEKLLKKKKKLEKGIKDINSEIKILQKKNDRAQKTIEKYQEQIIDKTESIKKYGLNI